MGMAEKIRAALEPLKEMDDDALDEWTRSQYHKYHHVSISYYPLSPLYFLFSPLSPPCLFSFYFSSISLISFSPFPSPFSILILVQRLTRPFISLTSTHSPHSHTDPLHVLHSHRGSFENSNSGPVSSDGHLLRGGKRPYGLRCGGRPLLIR